jgi:hypothetical protein
MKKNQSVWLLPLAGSLLLATAASSSQDPPVYLERTDSLDSTNRITGSIRFGLNITGKFLNPGGGFNARNPAGNGRRTARGDAYNYDDGYVLKDSSGNAGGQTWYWGYDNSSQVNASQANSIDLHRVTAPGLPGENSADTPSVGAEVSYDYQLGVKADWDQLRYGVEVAVNYMPFSFDINGSYNTSIATRTDTYAYTPGTTPPGAPYQGGYGGPGFLLGSSPINSTTTLVPGANLRVDDHFDADLWGFRLGPYIEDPLTEKFSLHASGGLAVGIVDANANWKETLTLPGGGGGTTTAGGGSDTAVKWGYYIGVDAVYQLSDHWGVDAGVQFQDLGTYSHDFGGRTAQLDLSQSVYVQLGVSYSF